MLRPVLVVHQDPTSHPAWTGEKSTLEQDGRAAQFLRKFGQGDSTGAATSSNSTGSNSSQ
jgi:ribosomal protein L31